MYIRILLETDTFRDETDTFAGVEEERKMSRKESTFIENKTYMYIKQNTYKPIQS
jgi:hypothetical protein